MRWTYSDATRTGYIYAENAPHHGPTGRFGAKAWLTGTAEPGPNENTASAFATREEAMLWVEGWPLAPTS